MQNLNNKRPLVIDLDGTIIFTDMLYENLLRFLKQKPLKFIYLFIWLLKGKAYLKQQLALDFSFNAKYLPYNVKFINWIKEQQLNGRYIILCTASDEKIAFQVSQYLGIFNEFVASNGCINLTGANKAKYLIERFGEKGFDYAGNSKADLVVWQQCSEVIVVNASKNLIAKTAQLFQIKQNFSSPKYSFLQIISLIRFHQWLKNLLLFVPILANHQLNNWSDWKNLLIAFAGFSLCASSVYIANDLLDLENDREHPRKRFRPIACGAITHLQGIIIAAILLTISIVISQFVNKEFFAVLTIYFIITSLYSWKIKSLILIDCIVLAMLYTLRILAGAIAVGLSLSFWLLAFSVFIFLSLAFVKRYSELKVMELSSYSNTGRAYSITDAPLIQTMGVTTGYISVLVLALYLNSETIKQLYLLPQLIWAAVPIMLFWISWIWIQAHQGKMHDDPVIFAVKDKVSIGVGIIFSAILYFGAIGINT